MNTTRSPVPGSGQREMPAAVQRSAVGAAMRADRRFRAAMLAGHQLAGQPTYPSRLFQGTGAEVRAVRDFVKVCLAGHPAADDAMLVASEFAANAIRHSASGRDGGMFLVHLSESEAGHMVVMVTDQGGPDIPHDVHASAHAESGRGLAVVEALTSMLTWFGDSDLHSMLAVVSADICEWQNFPLTK